MKMVGFLKPDNKILVAGNPLVQELKVETATNMYPGRLVKKGTNDDDIVVGTAGADVIGFLGYEQCRDSDKPANVDTAYAAGAWAPVLSGGGFIIVARLANGENVSKGARLVAAANGELKEASALAVPSGGTTVTSDKAQPDISGAVGSEGVVVAIAEESVDASGGAADIMVRSLI